MNPKENNDTQKQENHKDVIKPGNNKAEPKKMMKDTMDEALDKHRKNTDIKKESENIYKGSDHAGKYEAASQGKSDSDEETDALKNKKK